ncbi:MAG TPA: RodZ domain-containing protein [Candidatus Limnocylindrales bacterium]|jgi:cytoskeletal protein RodZ
MPGTESGARSPVAEAAPGLPERLYAARERKGVDLYRAERDTKIRARYLAALERGDWKELPGAVYTKGFLRNYALYLGLDPEDVLHQWRTERGEIRESEPIVVPRPIQAPRQGLVFSPGVVVAALLTVGVLLFVAYLGAQLLRFAKPPTLEVTAPSVALITVAEDDASYVLRGTSIPGATITVSTPGREQPYRVSADGSGGWAVPVELRRGKNQFDISAVDPETGKQAESPETVYITVPFLVIEAPGLTIDQPADGATFENGAIPVQGSTTNASTVVVSAHYLGPATTQQPATASPPPPTPDPQPLSVAVHEDGSYSTPLELTAGRWELTVTASSQTGKSNSLKRTVTVAYRGVNLTINVRGGPAWLKVWVDGKIAESIGASGRTISAGKTLTFTAQETIEVRTGSSGATLFTLNGTSLGALGPRGVPETWLFAPPSPPEKTQRT